MSEVNSPILSVDEERREKLRRRKRVNRIKTGILVFIFLWLLLCMGGCIFLGISLFKLQRRFDDFTKTYVEDYKALVDEIALLKVNGTPVSDEVTVDIVAAEEKFEPESDVSESNQDISKVYECISYAENKANKEDDHVVYLTFDDGPSDNTQEILDILDKHGVKATFFVTGRDDESERGMYRTIFEAGHTLGMHSYSHKYSELYASKDSFDVDFNMLYHTITEITGEKPFVYRFPGGSSNSVSSTDMSVFIDYLGEKGMTYYDWNVACGDATSQIYTVDDLVDNVINNVDDYKYSVVLLHDLSNKDKTVEALEIILDKLEEMNYKVLPIDKDSPVIHHVRS